MPLSSGQLIAQRYKVMRVLGQGGFGAVYLVEDTRLAGHRVALKETFDTQPEAVRQFQLEAEILARLSHPGLVRVSDRFEERGHQFLVMDFVEGDDLIDLIQRGAASHAQIIKWMIEVCDAVAYLHSQTPPIIHRDIKPPNIKIRHDGRAVLVDFGIAKVYNPQKQTAMVARAISTGFSPPEQYTGGTDARSDVYSLGATLYCALTATIPPEALDLVDQSAVLARPREIKPQISPAVEQVILKAMSLNLLARYPTAREMMSALQQCLGGAVVASMSPSTVAQGASIQQPLIPAPPERLQGAICPRCRQINRPGARFCQFDGTPLVPSTVAQGAVSFAPSAPVVTPQMRFEYGNRHFRKKDYARAVEEYAQALQGGFEHVALFYNLAGAYIELRRISEAIPVLQRGVGKYPQDAGIYALLGLAYIHWNQFTQAEQVLQRAVRLDARNFEAHLFTSMLHRQRQRPSDAVKWAQKAVRLEPNVAAGHFALGRAYAAQKKWTDAIAAFKRAAQLDANDPDPHAHLAACYLALKQKTAARAAAERARRIDPNNRAAQELLDRI